MAPWQFNSVAIIYFLAAGISLLLAYLGWRMRPVRGTKLFSTVMLFLSLWVIAYSIGLYSTDYYLKIMFLRFEYIGMAGAIYFWIYFISRYTQLDQWLNKWVFMVLAIIPVFTIICVFRAPNETYIHESYVLETINGLSIFTRNYTWGFFIWTAYAYTLLLAGLIFMIIRIIQDPGSTKNQLFFLLPIVFIVVIPNITFIIDKNIIDPYDPTPITLVLVGIILLINIYFYKFLDVVPVAHSIILKNVRAGVLIIDSRAHIIEVNMVVESIIGKTEKQLLGKSIFKVMPEISNVVKLDSAVLEIKSEIKLGADNLTYELTVNPLTDGSGNAFGQVLMLWDITEQKIVMTELDAYARTVAHDLKNPLNSVIGFTRLLVDGRISEDETRENLHNILVSGEKMKNIIDGLLMLAKIRNQENIEVLPLNMDNIIDSVCNRLAGNIKKANAELLMPLKWHSAIGNPIWLEEVWVNLIMNAIKYGGNPPKIEIGSNQEGDHIKYWVSDNGAGLDEDEQRKLFGEFTRMHPKRDSIIGHGLGLSIVQRIIRRLNGELSVESTKGVGSIFYFKLAMNRGKKLSGTIYTESALRH